MYSRRRSSAGDLVVAAQRERDREREREAVEGVDEEVEDTLRRLSAPNTTREMTNPMAAPPVGPLPGRLPMGHTGPRRSWCEDKDDGVEDPLTPPGEEAKLVVANTSAPQTQEDMPLGTPHRHSAHSQSQGSGGRRFSPRLHNSNSLNNVREGQRVSVASSPKSQHRSLGSQGPRFSNHSLHSHTSSPREEDVVSPPAATGGMATSAMERSMGAHSGGRQSLGAHSGGPHNKSPGTSENNSEPEIVPPPTQRSPVLWQLRPSSTPRSRPGNTVSASSPRRQSPVSASLRSPASPKSPVMSLVSGGSHTANFTGSPTRSLPIRSPLVPPGRSQGLPLGPQPSRGRLDSPKAQKPAPKRKGPADVKKTMRWKKGKYIGRGAFGEVCLGLNQDTGELMAVKTVMFNAKDKDIAKRLQALQQEIRVMRQLTHPKIVRYLCTERQGEQVNIFMEYVPGGSIVSLLKEFGALSEATMRNYTRQILEALAFLHGENVVHRDIKAANVLVSVSGDCKLADFGTAVYMREISATPRGKQDMAGMAGTPCWMAPEVVTESAPVGKPCDIWSLGCTVTEMIWAERPFWWLADNPIQMLNWLASEKEVTLPDSDQTPQHVGDQCRDFCLLCLRRDSTKRPTANSLLKGVGGRGHPFVEVIDESEADVDELEEGELGLVGELTHSDAGGMILGGGRPIPSMGLDHDNLASLEVSVEGNALARNPTLLHRGQIPHSGAGSHTNTEAWNIDGGQRPGGVGDADSVEYNTDAGELACRKASRETVGTVGTMRTAGTKKHSLRSGLRTRPLQLGMFSNPVGTMHHPMQRSGSVASVISVTTQGSRGQRISSVPQSPRTAPSQTTIHAEEQEKIHRHLLGSVLSLVQVPLDSVDSVAGSPRTDGLPAHPHAHRVHASRRTSDGRVTVGSPRGSHGGGTIRSAVSIDLTGQLPTFAAANATNTEKEKERGNSLLGYSSGADCSGELLDFLGTPLSLHNDGLLAARMAKKMDHDIEGTQIAEVEVDEDRGEDDASAAATLSPRNVKKLKDDVLCSERCQTRIRNLTIVLLLVAVGVLLGILFGS
eukprot:Hpha_TRINITY_DN13987_c0_g1::TRINITY_DN13987_c0_g1_i1::g.35961::m.35961